MGTGTKITELAAELRQCLEDALAARINPPAETAIVFGEDARSFLSIGTQQDRCCAGFAWVKVGPVTPDIPTDIGDARSRCGVHTWRVDFEMGVARCAPWGTVQEGPTVAQMLAGFTQQESDGEAMRAAYCCLVPFVETGRVYPTISEPFGPDGGCTGRTMGVALQIDDCDCPQEDNHG